MEMKFEAIFSKDRKLMLKAGINRITEGKSILKGGWHLITIKFFETRIFLRTKRNTTMLEIYGRVGKLLNISPRFIMIKRQIIPEWMQDR
jgi:hypothetical protein